MSRRKNPVAAIARMVLVAALVAIAVFYRRSELEARSNDGRSTSEALISESDVRSESHTAHTQEYGPGKVYFVTYEPQTEQNRNWEQTATIWETDAMTGMVRQLLVIEPYINEAPREVLPERELRLLEESKYFPPNISDRALMSQGLDTIALLSEELLLVVTHREVREVMVNNAYGYHDLQILDLRDGSLTSALILEYHESLIDETWGCGPAIPLKLGRKFSSNPTTDQFAFWVTTDPEYCGNNTFYNKSYFVVDYSTLPAQVEVIPSARELAWSPDGSMLAYAELKHTDENRWSANYVVRPAALGSEPRIVVQHRVTADFPAPLISWLDSHTIVYQYTDYETLSERPVWGAYDLETEQVVFSEELLKGEFLDLDYLYDGRSRLTYRWYDRQLRLMRYTADGTLVEARTHPLSPAPGNSRFRQYVPLGPMGDPVLHILKADMSISDFDLSPFVPPEHRLSWVVLGPPYSQ